MLALEGMMNARHVSNPHRANARRPGSRTERFNPRDELDIANVKIASMRWEIRELQAKLKVKVEMPKDVVALQRQLMAAKTELRNLKAGMKVIRRDLDEARRANPVTMTKKQFALLQKVFHPDPEHNTATLERGSSYLMLRRSSMRSNSTCSGGRRNRSRRDSAAPCLWSVTRLS
jgi:hypothetical protein